MVKLNLKINLVTAGWRPKRTIIFASWDAEEFGLLGSTEWAEVNNMVLLALEHLTDYLLLKFHLLYIFCTYRTWILLSKYVEENT